MKRIIAVAGILLFAVSVSGCATPFPTGVVYTELKFPVAVTPNVDQGTKVGVSKCQSILGLVATGDASIEAAKKNGGITKIVHVDWKAKNILGIIGEYECTVYGN
jgi:hypothetical protein